MPFQRTKLLEIRQSTVPTVKGHQFRLKTAFSCLLHHVSKMIVLRQTIFCLVVDAKITRQPTSIAGPYQRDQVDPLNTTMLARPVPRYQGHLRIIRLVQRGVIDFLNPCLSLNQWLNFLPQHLAIRWQSLQQSRIGIVRWRVFFRRVGSRSFNTAKHLLRRDQKVDVIHFVTFLWVHALSLACPPSTA